MSKKISLGKHAVQNLGMAFDDALAGFVRSRRLGNGGANKVSKDRTIFEYQYDLGRFFKFFPHHTHYNQLGESDLGEFLEDWQGRELADASKKKLLRSLRAFFHWIEQDRECQSLKMQSWNNLLPKIGKPEGRLYVPTPDAMLKFLNAFNTDAVWGLRDYVVTSILIDCGPRIGEICNMTEQSILWDQNRLLVDGKTGPRVVPITTSSVSGLKRWLVERKRIAKNGALFVTKFGGHCTPNTFDQSFADVRERSGAGKSSEGTLTPHTVRHYFCTHYLINGGTLSGLKAITGHTSLETLQIYVHMAEQLSVVAKEHEKASPLQSLGAGTRKKRRMY